MRVEIIDITDRSGSMDKLRADVIGGFNAFLADQKSVPGEARLTHIQFDNHYDRRYAGKDIQTVVPLNIDTYRPGGGTALLDAIGRTLHEQGERIKTENWAEKVIVCIRTDGEENSSHEYQLPQIKTMIEHAQKHGWEFIFSAANQDAFSVGASYGISGVNTTKFAATSAGLSASYASTSNVMRSMRDDQNTNIQQVAQDAYLLAQGQVKI